MGSPRSAPMPREGSRRIAASKDQAPLPPSPSSDDAKAKPSAAGGSESKKGHFPGTPQLWRATRPAPPSPRARQIPPPGAPPGAITRRRLSRPTYQPSSSPSMRTCTSRTPASILPARRIRPSPAARWRVPRHSGSSMRTKSGHSPAARVPSISGAARGITAGAADVGSGSSPSPMPSPSLSARRGSQRWEAAGPAQTSWSPCSRPNVASASPRSSSPSPSVSRIPGSLPRRRSSRGRRGSSSGTPSPSPSATATASPQRERNQRNPGRSSRSRRTPPHHRSSHAFPSK